MEGEDGKPALDGMRKADVIKELSGYKKFEELRREMAVVELKALLSILRDSEKPEKFPRGFSSMSLCQLKTTYHETFGRDPAVALSRGLLMMEIRNHVAGTQTPKEEVPADDGDWLLTHPTTRSTQPTRIAAVIQAASARAPRKNSEKNTTNEEPAIKQEAPKSCLSWASKVQQQEMRFDTEELRKASCGTHKGKSYELMMKKHPQYCDW